MVLPSLTRHSGYSADDAKNIGKITKFIAPAKFSSCLLTDDISMPSAPSMRPDRTRAGRTATYPSGGASISQNQAMARNGETFGSDTAMPAPSFDESRNQRGVGLTSSVRMLPISRS